MVALPFLLEPALDEFAVVYRNSASSENAGSSGFELPAAGDVVPVVT